MQPDVSQCPRCAFSLNQDFGFVTCSNCGIAMMIGSDGQITLFTESNDESKSLENGLPEIMPEKNAAVSSGSSTGSLADTLVDSLLDSSEVVESNDAFEFENSPNQNLEENLPDEGEQESIGGYFESLDNSESASSDEFQPISDYAASDRSSAREGLYLYTLTIAGLDTLEMEDELRSMLEDSRLGVDAEAVIKNIHSGVAIIEGIGPVKASVLVNRMRETLLRVSWKQVSILQE